MHAHSTIPPQHNHDFLGRRHTRNELRTVLVVLLSLLMMVVEIGAGLLLGSMALLADGLHMATHAGALALAAAAYFYARRLQHHPAFAFGTGKLGDLAAFTSAILLAAAAVMIGWESVQRFAEPKGINFPEAIAVATIGLVVNLVGAWLLHDSHAHDDHGSEHHDHNHRAAYLHIVADALTSVLAIAGLFGAMLMGWTWADPAAGLLGAIIIGHWALQLVRQAGGVLLDAVQDPQVAMMIRTALECEGDRITDLHVWRLGPGHLGAVLALNSETPRSPEHYKAKLSHVRSLSHITVEVHEATPTSALANSAVAA